jgi:hypothetical protein
MIATFKFELGDPERADVTANVDSANQQKMEAVKKGQSEFVEFVEPSGHNNRIKNVEWLEKRSVIEMNLAKSRR